MKCATVRMTGTNVNGTHGMHDVDVNETAVSAQALLMSQRLDISSSRVVDEHSDSEHFFQVFPRIAGAVVHFAFGTGQPQLVLCSCPVRQHVPRIEKQHDAEVPLYRTGIVPKVSWGFWWQQVPDCFLRTPLAQGRLGSSLTEDKTSLFTHWGVDCESLS